MHLLIIRHAIAEDRDTFAASGAPDDDRPLTSFGKRRMRRNVEGLHRVAPHLDVLAASPLVRADQTARIVASAFKVSEVATVEALRPERRPADLLPWLARQGEDATVAIVGHEPHLGILLNWLVSGVEAHGAGFRKGGAAMVEFSGRPASGRGVLLWMLTPSQLRSLGD
jgi:phosphohistidine phosphatase